MIARTLAIVTAAILISSCSILGTKKVEVVSKPVQLDIIQPTLPRPLELDVPKWYVVSEAIITNPCKKVLDEETGKEKRPKQCDLEERENPDWPVGYTYLDRFLDDMKRANAGDVLFVATTISDYQLMSTNVQELRRYIRELGVVIAYYEVVTMTNGDKGVGASVKKNEN